MLVSSNVRNRDVQKLVNASSSRNVNTSIPIVVGSVKSQSYKGHRKETNTYRGFVSFVASYAMCDLYRIVGGFDRNIHVVRMALFETGRRNLHEDTVVFQGFDIGSTAIAHTR